MVEVAQYVCLGFPPWFLSLVVCKENLHTKLAKNVTIGKKAVAF